MNTILLVDDDLLFLKAVTAQVDFQRIGYGRVFTATGADQAESILAQEQIDVLLCDIEMPGKSGMELIHEIVAKDYQVVILLLTCHSNFEYAKEAIGLEVFDYLLKPIRMPVLCERLEKALQKRKELNWLRECRSELSKLPTPSDHDKAQRIRAFIEENIQTALTREQLGQALCMNPDYVARIFKDSQGMSLNDYIRIRRISRVKKLLLETDLSVPEICAMVGYSYNSYFFNQFKKHTELSPLEYRNRYKK